MQRLRPAAESVSRLSFDETFDGAGRGSANHLRQPKNTSVASVVMTEVAAADVVKLMLQFCQENSLQRTMQTLQVCARPRPPHPTPHPTPQM